MNKQKNQVGRPAMPQHLKAKPISMPVRIPVKIVELIKTIARQYKDGSIDISDLEAFVAMRGDCNAK